MRRVITIPLATVSLLFLIGCERWALDRQMEELCKKDGGVKVYETVTLAPEMFDQSGNPFPEWRSRTDRARLGADYRLIEDRIYLKRGDPMKGEGQLSRFHWRVIRNADDKVLGEGVSYGRSGGDFVVLGHFTSKSCPLQFGEAAAVIQAVFVKRDK